MNSQYRCSGCRGYFPVPAFRTIGLVRVCSAACSSTVVRKKPDRDGRPAPRVRQRSGTTVTKNEIPAKTRALVVLRDNGRCRRCGGRSLLQLHHLNYRSEGVDHAAHNLVLLCGGCHDWAHANKRARKPLLLQYIWLLYVEGRQVYIMQLER